MKKTAITIFLTMMLSALFCLGVYAEAGVETPVNICCIGDLYSVDYEFEVSGTIKNVRCDISGGSLEYNYDKQKNTLNISFAASTAVKGGRVATIISDEAITLTPKSVRLNGWKTETACIYHAETAMDKKDPTCDSAGSHGGVKCTRCGYVISEPTISPATGPQITAKLSAGGTLTVSGAVSDSETTENCVMLGIYEDSKLLDCVDISNKPQNKLNIEIENMQGADMVKIFRWSSLSSMTPLYGAVEVEVK